MSDVPAGFALLGRTTAFTDLLMPIYEKIEVATVTVGVRVMAHHCNVNGIMHGGMVSTLADLALGRTVRQAAKMESIAITASLNIDFAGSARLGEWLEVRPQVLRLGRRLGFANCSFVVGDTAIGQATGVFAL